LLSLNPAGAFSLFIQPPRKKIANMKKGYLQIPFSIAYQKAHGTIHKAKKYPDFHRGIQLKNT